MSDITHHHHHDLLNVHQQLLMGEVVDQERAFRLGRSCLAHCVSVARLMLDDAAEVTTEELVDFIDTFGPGNEEKGYYVEGEGWVATSMADLLRAKSHPVVSQNLKITSEATDIEVAESTRRVTTEREKELLRGLSKFGGEPGDEWIGALRHTVEGDGLAVASITIPSISGEGTSSHNVLVFDVDDARQRVEYIDPDTHALFRYGGDAVAAEDIQPTRDPGTPLYYSQPFDQFVGRMTGQVMHIFPPTNS